MEHRANINIRDAENKTPLHIAIENCQDDIIALLLSVPEIDLSLRDKSGLTPFATALTYRNNKAAEAILEKMPSAAEQVKKDFSFIYFFSTVYQISNLCEIYSWLNFAGGKFTWQKATFILNAPTVV